MSQPPTAPAARASQRVITLSVMVAALGYFVDIYDLLLFSIVRVPSLRSLGVQGDDLLHAGERLLNMQMTGMLLGGLLWGVLGDRRGRLSVLFGSIFMYSAANIANAWVQSRGDLRMAALHRRHRAGRRAGRGHHAGQRDHAEGDARIRHDDRRGDRHPRGGCRGPRRRLLRLAHLLHRRRRHGLRAARAADRRLRVGNVREREADRLEPWQRAAAVQHLGAGQEVRGRDPDRRAHLVRHRYPDHLLAGDRPGARHDGSADRGQCRDVCLPRAGRRRLRQWLPQSVPGQPAAGGVAVPGADGASSSPPTSSWPRSRSPRSTRSVSHSASVSATGRCS